MFKKTVIAAVALLAGVAAQAQVTVYGNLDLSVGRFDFPFETDSVNKVESGVLRESFLGFKGQEDLGGGLKAFFALESVVGADNGSAGDGNFWSRTSIIGLSGDFGTVALGNNRTLNFLANQAYNPFGATGLFSTSNVLFNDGNNVTDSITYTSPNLSGFTAAVQLGLSETDVDGSDDNAVGLQLAYTAGPLSVGFTYQDATDYRASDSKLWQLGASYDFGAAKLFGQVGKAEEDDSDNDYKFWQLGVSVPVSDAGSVLASYAQGKDDDGKGRQFSLAYDHNLSKRTGAYIGVINGRVKPEGGDSESGTSFVVGVRHSF